MDNKKKAYSVNLHMEEAHVNKIKDIILKWYIDLVMAQLQSLGEEERLAVIHKLKEDLAVAQEMKEKKGIEG